MKTTLISMIALAALAAATPAAAKGSGSGSGAPARTYSGVGGPLETGSLSIGDKVERSAVGLYVLPQPYRKLFYDLGDRYVRTDGQLIYDIGYYTGQVINAFPFPRHR